ncbi:hypothetical protein MMC12_000957 [Toensbergia leucococca]|nr:hypothetical protein [Toensbergia leucococca]
MVWEQLSINKPHLAYIIVGGFTSLFMLCSLFVKEKLYIGEATVATICGVIFGPHAANLFNPLSWGNTDQITLECSRIVLVVQCFAVGVELPKSYMERHWRSVVFLLIPVMTFGWLMTSLFIWWMIAPLTWLESLCCAACVTATDPVLASSVVGKGKFAKRVPKHLRDLLSAESGCNDGMAFPFIYLSLYLIRYRPDASEVAYHWICFTILYECVFGAVYGVLIGYLGRHAIKWADGKGLIDRESFLVFYFVLALFCAGSGSLLGIDDLLVGFAAGVGFSNDGWFTQKTEESHVSNVIDLLLNLAYFVYLGSIIPWGEYNSPDLGMKPWRLVVIAIFVVLFRRIPIVMALKPLIPDIKTWREALFAGHFGPIGVGAIFAAILARAELENYTTVPEEDLPGPGSPNYYIIQIIWPLTTFLVITSILVHGSSIAVFTLGKRINTLSLTLSYTQAPEDGPAWMNRLPRIQSRSKSMSKANEEDMSIGSSNEKLPEFAPGTLPPVGLPGNFLRRQKEDDNPSNNNSRASSVRPSTKRKKWDSGMGPGGPISRSAIAPQRKPEIVSSTTSVSDTLGEKSNRSPDSQEKEESPDGLEMQEEADKREEEEKLSPRHVDEPMIEAYQEGDNMVIEDEEGNVLSVEDTRGETDDQKKQHLAESEAALRKETSGEHAKGRFHPHAKNEGEDVEHAVQDSIAHPGHHYRGLKKKLGEWSPRRQRGSSGSSGSSQPKQNEHKRGPAHAYQFGNTIIVEDEDGEVVKKYDIPSSSNKRGQAVSGADVAPVRRGLQRVGTWAGLATKGPEGADGQGAESSGHGDKEGTKNRLKSILNGEDDDGIRFTVEAGGRRMSKTDFIRQIQQLDPKARCEAVEESNVPEAIKEEAREEHRRASQQVLNVSSQIGPQQGLDQTPKSQAPMIGERHQQGKMAEVQKVGEHEDRLRGKDGLTLVDSHGEDIPFHSVPDSLTKYSPYKSETAAQRRRRMASRKDSDDDGTERVPPAQKRNMETDSTGPATATGQSSIPRRSTLQREDPTLTATGETQAERRRRLAALGEGGQGAADSDSDDDGGERRPDAKHKPVEEPKQDGPRAPGIRFADSPAVSQGRVQWGEDVGRKGRGKWIDGMDKGA